MIFPPRAVAVFAAAAWCAACSSEPKATPAAAPVVREAESTLPPASLPDLSRTEPAVQQQLTAAAQRLMSQIDGRAPAAVLARAYGDVGNLLMAAEYIDAAEPYYRHAQALAPDEVHWPYYLGHVYMARAEPARAIAAFERALQLRPADVAAMIWLGNIYLDQGQPERAEPLFTQAIAAQPRTVAALFGLGRAALARRAYAGAVDRFEQVLAADPRASIAHYPLALAYRGLGETSKAEAHLRQQGGIEVGPPDPMMAELRELLHGAVAEETRGVRALNGGDYAAAAQYFRKGVELAPDNPSIRHKLGTALAQMGDARGAAEQLQETVRRTPNFAPAYYSLGLLLAGSGRYPEAIPPLSAAVRFEPSYIDARLQLGEALSRTGQWNAALAQYRQALTIDSRSAEGQFGYARALIGLQRYREAVGALSEGARLHPDQPRFGEALARVQGALQGRR